LFFIKWQHECGFAVAILWRSLETALRLPAANYILEKYEMDEWHLLEVSTGISDIKAGIREALKKTGQIVAVSPNVQ
jgi:hypothetical protein